MKSAKIFEKVLENVESLLDILTRKWNFNQVPGPVADMALFSWSFALCVLRYHPSDHRTGI